jgi:hypothetical protein
MSTYYSDNLSKTTKNVCETVTILESYNEDGDCDALNEVLWI